MSRDGPGAAEMMPLVSVITPSFNAAATIERTIASVLAQTYTPIEYFVIDGGSVDGTVDIVRKYEHRIARWVSEPDAGIADAFNKGLALAQGKYVLFVNADDWLDPAHVATAVEILEANSTKAFVYGDLLHYRAGEPAFLQRGSGDYLRGFGYQMGRLNHPSMVCRREFFERIGVFDTRYTIAMDFHWLQRLHRAGFDGIYSQRLRGNMEAGGLSGRQAARALRETRQSSISVGYNAIACWAYYFWARTKLFLRQMIEKHLSHRVAARTRARLFGSIETVSPAANATKKP